MNTTSKIQIINKTDNTILEEFPMSFEYQAYIALDKYNEMGIEAEITIPSVARTLANSLGIQPQEIKDFEESIHDEIESHDDSCASCPPSNQKQ
jgi:hypothetical protein